MAGNREQLTRWMDRASGSDERAFGSLAGAIQDDLYRFAMAQGLGADDAAEAVQEALLRAWRTRLGWRRGGDALTWLCGVTLNVVREIRRGRQRDRTVTLDADGIAAKADAAGACEPAGESLAALEVAIEALPPRQREAVVCRYLRRLSVRETAAVMGCAEGTVKAALAAGLENLRSSPALRYAEGAEGTHGQK